YQWVETYEPELFARIQRLVREGRWHIMGGWFLQPDCNMPSGESFVRQILVGRRYFDGEFGAHPTTAINFDPFGHTRGLVQIMAKSGYDSYVFCRPSEGDCHLPDSDFAWVGYDGSEVVGHRTMVWYLSALGGARKKVEGFLGEYPDRDVSLLLWGVGDHGGGPSRIDVQDLEALIAETEQTQIVHSTPEAYFANLLSERGWDALPRHERDINPWAVGCYTSQVRIKQQHRALESALYSAEKMASTAALQGILDYPKADLAAAQRDLLFSEFHDILPGSSVQPVEEMSLRVLGHGLETLSRLRARTFFALAQGQPRAAEGEIPILVYNPHPYAITTTVACEFQMADQNWDDTYTQAVAMQDGVALPTQVEKEAGNLNLDWRKKVVFNAVLAPSRMSRFDCRLEVLPEKPSVALMEQDGVFHFQTDELEVIINAASGLIDRYRVRGVDYLAPGALAALVISDDEDPWGMRTRAYRDVLGAFSLMTPVESAAFSGVRVAELPAVRVIEDGDVRTVIEAVFGYGRSAICTRYLLPKRGTELGLDMRVLWLEKDRMLKLSVPTAMPTAAYMGQVAYGVGELPVNGDEAVAQKWVAVVDPLADRALTCINDGTYGSDFSGGELRLTLLRSPAYSGHPIGDRPVVPQDRFTPRIDQGERLYHFWLNAGAVQERLEAIDREALVQNERPFALSFFPHGEGVKPHPGLLLDDDVVQLAAFKQAEDGNGYIIRLFEPTGHRRRTVLSVPGLEVTMPVALNGFEIKTLRLDPATGSIVETDLMES
ncbi:MAG: alpha-mannosidase, partial [Anaerolineae bacterium]|nr:alpha-mannosidase [Anaerolineae bacterium]